jgi:hypothetical protein
VAGDEPTVMHLLGQGRSGSTILANVLGEYARVFHGGELRTLWSRGYIQRSIACGCGRAVPECPLWAGVYTDVFGKGDLDLRSVVAAQKAVVRLRNIRRLGAVEAKWMEGSRTEDWPALRILTESQARLYRSLRTRTKAVLIVDSSMSPAYAAISRAVPGIQPTLVQVVRDPRAVAYSLLRRRRVPTPRGVREMPRKGPVGSAFGWVVRNVASNRVLLGASAPVSLVRYEDFVLDPRVTAEKLLSLAGLAPEGDPFLNERTVGLGQNHTAGGNPVRMRSGPTEIRADEDWMDRQHPIHRRVVTFVTLPWLRRYGYPRRVPLGAGARTPAV